MGTTYCTRKRGDLSDLEFFRKEFDFRDEIAAGKTSRVLAAVTYKRVAYIAWRCKETERVMAIVCPTTWKGDLFSYHYMDEKMGLCDSEAMCPLAVLNFLDPVLPDEDPHRAMRDWRYRCRARFGGQLHLL